MELIDLTYFAVFGVMIFSASMMLSVYLFNRNRVKTDPETSTFPSLTFLVPAYNEKEHVSDCINSLLNQSYEGEIDIIAINDGSEDSTLEELEKFEDEIEIIDKPNTGKANSMNQALERVDTDLVACMDADSIADKDMVKNMVGYFEEEDVKGVTPAMKVRNPESWAEKMIWTEFTYNILLRKLFAIFDAQWVMPGPGSIYETQYLKELDGWDEETLTEDMEIAFRMFKNGGKLRSTTNAFTITESPDSFRGLFNQRLRWYRGYISNNLRYKDLWFNPQFGNLGLVILPFNLILTSTIVFLASHMVIRIFNSIFDAVNNYLLLGSFSPGFRLSIFQLSVFHIFYLVMGITGFAMLVLSIKSADEKFKLLERKVHYVLFLSIYGPTYAVFWIAALIKEIANGGKEW
ncbi:glycosyltransferase [Candidatus Nanohalobium constans]|uniref:Glycosyl transferase family 2, poly-beta-1,6 N-acetyl-D-glucosamine synthase n=1 Tax=Candidatus Nanohalobium constans TaxID=2565781 RepID=A0A5Q0UFY2_9ARCH|nr:glycosyltransferase family 2 protein [Candidatus Nanohalobium constans]QGA80110.1 glycosyl transferase family 2, poly-beta-1,6 N-acetyl-D-glucosamine synthase [Candidatus Nanohalobium constans]